MSESETGKERACRLSRRGFITILGVGALAATERRAEARPEKEVLRPEEMTKVALLVNGRPEHLLVEPRWSLLYVLREKLGLTGAKAGCERGECGACTVLIDDVPRYACMVLAVEAQGCRITTLEGLLDGEELGATQKAFLESDAFQCGYCTPGQIMAVEGLLRANPEPSPEQVRWGMSGNLCRCGTYRNIFLAARRAAELKKAAAKKEGKP